MTALSEKLKIAGADTLGAEFTTLCVEALRLHPNNVGRAWDHVGAVFGQGFLLGLMNDMNGGAELPRAKNAPEVRQVSSIERVTLAPPSPYKPRVIPPERVEKRRELQQIVRSKYKNSGNVSWSDVGWHELQGLKRDGNEALALLNAGPANVPNDGRSVGDVLGVRKTDEIIGQVRANREIG